MQNTVTNVFDNGDLVGGNNLLTSTIQHIDFTTANYRLTTFAYDFRNRRTTATQYIVPTGTVSAIVTLNTLDNLDRVHEWCNSTTQPSQGERVPATGVP